MIIKNPEEMEGVESIGGMKVIPGKTSMIIKRDCSVIAITTISGSGRIHSTEMSTGSGFPVDQNNSLRLKSHHGDQFIIEVDKGSERPLVVLVIKIDHS